MGLSVLFFIFVILALIVVGFVFVFKSSNSSKNTQIEKDLISPGNYCLEKDTYCSEGYICDSEDGICIKEN